MKKIMGLLLYGLAVFGIAAGAGWVMRPKPHAPDAHADAGAHGSGGTAGAEGHGTHGTGAADGATASGDHSGEAHGTNHSEASDGGHAAAAETSHANAAGSGASAGHDSSESGEHSDKHDGEHGAPKKKRRPDELPVVTRPRQMTVEEIVRYSLGLKARDEVVRARELALHRTESQQRMVMTDIRGEQREIESMLTQAREQRLAAEEILNRMAINQQKLDSEHKQLLSQKEQEHEAERKRLLAQKQTELQTEHSKVLAAKQQELEELQKAAENLKQAIQTQNAETPDPVVTISPEQPAVSAETPPETPAPNADEARAAKATRLNELAAMIQGMTPEVVAAMMTELANDGDMEMVVQLVSGMEPRKATAVLEAVGSKDPKLGVDILNRYSELPKPPKSPKAAKK